MCVYINSQLSLNKHAECLVLAQQEVAAVCTGVSPVLWATCWLCRGGTVWGVICLKHFVMSFPQALPPSVWLLAGFQ